VLDVPVSTPALASVAITNHGTPSERLATRRGEKCGLGVVAAMRSEAATINKHQAPGTFRVRISGMGLQRARDAAEALIAEGAGALVSWGIAGGLVETLQPGDMVLATRIESGTGAESLDTPWSECLLQAFREADIAVERGVLWCDAGAVTSVAAKQTLAARGYALVDMESAAVARVAREAGVPCVVVKCIGDPASQALPPMILNMLHPDGRVRLPALVATLARGPRTWRTLGAMMRDFNVACASLRRAAPVLVNTCPP
jgi:adenosylhomocysteine nucleosidase